MAPTQTGLAGNTDLPWYWEGNVQAQVAKFLVAGGWTIVSAADTATRQRGIDLVAASGERRLAVEVKGFPGTVYARGERAGQPKPTPPTLQARHWLGEALLAAILAGATRDYTEVAMAFPDMPRYRSLLERIRYATDRIGLRVFLADESGEVTEVPRGTP